MGRPVGRWWVLVGMWPVVSGNVIGRRPCGSTSPVRTCARAVPASVPGCQTTTTAAARSRTSGEVERAPGVDDGDDGLAQRRDVPQDVELPRGQADVGDAAVLARAAAVLAEEHHGRVGPAGDLEDLVGVAAVEDVEALAVADPLGLAEPGPQRVGRGDDLLAAPVEDPGPEEGVAVVDERAGEQHPPRRLGQRQHPVVLHEDVGGERRPAARPRGWRPSAPATPRGRRRRGARRARGGP